MAGCPLVAETCRVFGPAAFEAAIDVGRNHLPEVPLDTLAARISGGDYCNPTRDLRGPSIGVWSATSLSADVKSAIPIVVEPDAVDNSLVRPDRILEPERA